MRPKGGRAAKVKERQRQRLQWRPKRRASEREERGRSGRRPHNTQSALSRSPSLPFLTHAHTETERSPLRTFFSSSPPGLPPLPLQWNALPHMPHRRPPPSYNFLHLHPLTPRPTPYTPSPLHPSRRTTMSSRQCSRHARKRQGGGAPLSPAARRPQTAERQHE